MSSKIVKTLIWSYTLQHYKKNSSYLWLNCVWLCPLCAYVWVKDGKWNRMYHSAQILIYFSKHFLCPSSPSIHSPRTLLNCDYFALPTRPWWGSGHSDFFFLPSLFRSRSLGVLYSECASGNSIVNLQSSFSESSVRSNWGFYWSRHQAKTSTYFYAAS